MRRRFRFDTAAIGAGLGPHGHGQIATLWSQPADVRTFWRLTRVAASNDDRESTSERGSTQRVLKALLSAQKPPLRPKNWPAKFPCNSTTPTNFPCNSAQL